MSKDVSHIQPSVLFQDRSGALQYSYDINGNFEYVSSSVISVLGYSSEEFLCHFKTYLVDSPIKDYVEKLTLICCQGLQQEPYEISTYHKNGSVKCLLVSEAANINAEGKVVSVYGIAFDISSQKKSQNELLNIFHKEVHSHQITREINKQALKQMGRVRRLWNDTQRSYEIEKRRYRSIISSSFDAILILDASGTIKEVNPAAIEIFGWQSKEFLQKKMHDIIPSYHCSVECGDCFSHMHESVGVHKDKHKIFVEVVPKLIMLKTETILSITIRDVSDRKKAESLVQNNQIRLESRVSQRTAQLKHANNELKILANKMKALNRLDELTGIYNRRGFDEEYDKEWKRAYRTKNSIAIIMIDIDYFKKFNDSYGHQDGDSCLKKVSATLANSVHRTTDCVCRYGGEEFVVILPETSETGALHVAELFRREVEKLQINHCASTVSDYVTISLGVTVSIPCDGDVQNGLVKQADKALYQAKELRNHIMLA